MAQGGTSIRLFDPDDYKNYIASAADWLQSGVKAYGNDGNAMGRIIEVAKKAQEKGVIKGIIFHQGETDGGMSNWEQIVKKTYEYMLDQLGLTAEETPFVAGEMVDGGSCAGFNSHVHNLAQYIENFSYASSAGYGSKGDGLHFTVEGYRGMGERYAQEMLKLINVAPVEPEPQTPFKGQAFNLSSKIEAEDFDIPGKGKGNNSYSVSGDCEDTWNTEYRKGTSVKIGEKNGGFVLGCNPTGNYFQYTINVAEAGTFDISATVAANDSGALVFKVGDKVVSDTLKYAGTSWTTFDQVKGSITLDKGEQILTMEVARGYIDIDWFQISKAGEGPDAISQTVDFEGNFIRQDYRVFDMNGSYMGVVRAAGVQELKAASAKLVKRGGAYLAKSEAGKILRIQVAK